MKEISKIDYSINGGVTMDSKANREATKDRAHEVMDKAVSIRNQAGSLQITDDATYSEAAQLLLAIKNIRREIDNTFDPIISRAYEAHKEAVAQKKRVEAPIVEAERIIKQSMAKYHQEIERRKREEEAKLRAEALKKAEEEKLKLAVELEQKGDKEMAQAVIEEPIYVAPVKPKVTTPKVSGIAKQTRWTFRIVNEALIPREYLKVDEAKIRRVVMTLKNNHGIPGIEAYPETIITAGNRGGDE